MRWIKRISILVFIGVVAGGFFSLSLFLRNPERFKGFLTAQIENRLGTRLSFQESKVVFTPFPAVQIKGALLELEVSNLPSLRAEEVRFSFHFLPLLWGRLELSGFQMKKGEGIFWGIPLSNMFLKIRDLSSKKFSPFEWRADGADEKEIVEGKGGVALQNQGENIWIGSGFKGDIAVKGFDLSKGVAQDLLKHISRTRMSGELAGKLHLEKEKGKSIVDGTAEFALNNFRSGSSEAFSLTGHGELLWNLEGDSAEFKEISVTTPFGDWDGRGVLNVETGEIGEVRLTGRKVVLDELVRRFPGLQSALPLDTGFSGESELDLTVQGTWDYLSLHTNWDLTPVVLTYGKVFSKPKDFPMVINADLLLKGGDVLSGDLSVRIGQMTAKGTVVGLDLKTGVGELTILTNKFELKGWKSLLSPLAKHELSGSAKVLLNWKGNLTQLGKTERSLNLTLDDATLLSPSGRGIRKANGFFDISALSLRVKDARFEIGGSLIQVAAEIFNLKEKPQGKVEVTASQLDLFALFENLETFHSFFLSEKTRASWKEFKGTLQRYLPKPFALDRLSLSLVAQPGKLALENLSFQALNGDFHIRGETDWPSEKQNFWFETELDRASLARYFEGMGKGDKFLDGNLFFKGRFQGQGAKLEDVSENLSGQGTLSVTNGEWDSLDLMSPLVALGPLHALTSYRFRSTPFLDLKATWNYAKGKFDTNDFILNSDQLWVEGQGNVSTQGVLNSRLRIYLSKALTDKVLKSWGAAGKGGGKQLGPFPFLLVGNLSKPQAKADDRFMETFLLAIRNRRFREILRSPFSG